MYSANLPVCTGATRRGPHAHAAVTREGSARGGSAPGAHRAQARNAALRARAHRTHPQNAVRRHGDAAARVRLLVPVVQVGDRLHAQLRRLASERRAGAGGAREHGTAAPAQRRAMERRAARTSTSPGSSTGRPLSRTASSPKSSMCSDHSNLGAPGGALGLSCALAGPRAGGFVDASKATATTRATGHVGDVVQASSSSFSLRVTVAQTPRGIEFVRKLDCTDEFNRQLLAAQV